MRIRKTWSVFGASVSGKNHKITNTPCQDAYNYCRLDTDWILAVVCDGAGSARYSDWAARFTADSFSAGISSAIAAKRFDKERWTIDRWSAMTLNILLNISHELERQADKQKATIQDFACTFMAILAHPALTFTAHIGDGRMAYLNKNGEWNAGIIPFRGEYVNETAFLTSDNSLQQYLQMGVIAEEIEAFALLTDGCERHSFVCQLWNEAESKLIDLNQPFPNFFNPVCQHLQKLQKEGLSEAQIQQSWADFWTKGTPSIENEPDDKTMVIGFLSATMNKP
jgi:hypothetical protein